MTRAGAASNCAGSCEKCGVVERQLRIRSVKLGHGAARDGLEIPLVRDRRLSQKITAATLCGGVGASLSRKARQCPTESAPLSQWTVEEAFDTARECKNKLNSYMLNALHSGSGECHGFTPRMDAINDAQCVATDDPRLKGK